ncbi:lipoprotein-releasing ABC transporter ATP-binding protein LolD [Thiomicrorhabdus sp. zzn3]|uniref:lipoprotein-releasing ABC transporter ATP-binding protein LolD n=1 Tax=Thiomicrorhabdus sp. zzn3 TaxID=3039775 RepID=UPI002437030F|nr:lipoprotein-releasing ABC transporter ATP-binding protein LolD [Thiomicrorhabdus sp. zzn3]MDG6778096.1 lipoprotein-releasing ABC transporter ATP-binding protein LolD [Thiomicrorhabdus sp. zzn3]
MSNQNSVLSAQRLQKIYQEGPIETRVLTDVNLDILAGEMVAIVGASGSGKSTLLHLLAGLDQPTSGEVKLNDQPFSELSDVKRGQMRNVHMGFVYQFHHLLPELTALENVMMPLRIRRENAQSARMQAQALLERVGLGHRLKHKPSELSGGERQRVSIARALITRPAVILADEPTGNLDHDTAEQVFQMMQELNQELQTALLIVTHDRDLAKRMNRQLHLRDGQLHAE